MGHRICPWWLGYLLVSPIRRWLQDPAELLAPYIKEVMTALEPGPGMGFFTIELARLVGPSGRVVAVDVQPKMISSLRRRAAKAGVTVDTRVAPEESLGIGDLTEQVDFTLAFAMVHKMPSSESFFAQVATGSKQGATLLLAEPAGHVSEEAFAKQLHEAEAAGFSVAERPTIKRCHAALLRRR